MALPSESSLITNALVASRVAASVLNQVATECRLGNMAVKWNGDDTSQWAVDLVKLRVVALTHGGMLAAEVFLEEFPEVIRIEVPECDRLVRDEHLDKFDPGQHGMEYVTEGTWNGDKFPDLVVTTGWTGPMPTGPRVHVPREEPIHQGGIAPRRGAPRL